MFDDLFGKLPTLIQTCIGVGTILAIAFGGQKVLNQRRQMRPEREIDPFTYAIATAERIERGTNDRFDRLERCLVDIEKDNKDGFHRLERLLSDLGKEVSAMRQRRR